MAAVLGNLGHTGNSTGIDSWYGVTTLIDCREMTLMVSKSMPGVLVACLADATWR